MGITTILGILLAIACILGGFILENGDVTALAALSSLLIVVGGTLSVVIASFPPSDLKKALKAFAGLFGKKGQPNPKLVIEKIANISEMCRRNGILKIEEALKDKDLDSDDFLFLKQGLVFILDFKEEEEIQYTMASDIRTYMMQRQQEISVFETAGGFAPTLGVVGTVLSLVVTLGSMGDKSSAELAHAISTAFIATFYGVGFANLIFIPIANRLKAALKRQKVQREMILDGVCMIARGEASRNVENKLALYWQAFPGGDKLYKEGILS